MSEPSKIVPPYDALRAYERAAYQRHPNSNEALFQLIHSLVRCPSTTGLLVAGASRDAICNFYTRIAAAITTHVQTPGFRLSNAEFYRLCNDKVLLETAFALSGFGHAQHILESVIETDPGGGTVLRESAVFFSCLFFSLDNIPDLLMQAALNLPPDMLLPLMLGWLSSHRVLTVEGEARRIALLEAHERVAGVLVPAEVRRSLCHAYMYCTYADTPRRHVAKKTFNALWRRIIDTEGVKPKLAPPPAAGRKPRMVVAAERWRHDHAMYRCYAPCIEQLRERFELVLLVEKTEWDAKSGAMFDEVHELPVSDYQLRDLAGMMVRLKPQVIYYPSLGMSGWTQMLASVRFAPIQFMTPGHPATSMSEHIDYMLVIERCEEGAPSVNETVIVRRGNGHLDRHPELPDTIEPEAGEADGHFHIAVHGAGMKLSARFLAACNRIQAASKRPLHFHFFPGALGFHKDDLYMRLGQLLNAPFTLHPYLPYPRLLQLLARCDLALAPYPFGNTNSTTDACLAGVPTVCYRAPEIHCLGDKMVILAAELPEWLLTHDDASYQETALRLIHDDAAREALRASLRAPDLRSRLFNSAPGEDAQEFGNAVWWMYANHAAIKRSGRHCLTAGEQLPD